MQSYRALMPKEQSCLICKQPSKISICFFLNPGGCETGSKDLKRRGVVRCQTPRHLKAAGRTAEPYNQI